MIGELSAGLHQLGDGLFAAAPIDSIGVEHFF
jgi:hypothetical protein